MRFETLLNTVSTEPVFATSILMTAGKDSADIHKQLARWRADGKLFQLRRGLYALAPPYQKVVPDPFVVANHLKPASYVSLQSALAHYGMIPEYVPEVTSVTTNRPEKLNTPLGRYSFRHVKQSLFFGFRRIEIAQNQEAFVATPEKALLDLVYLTPHADDQAYLENLRLQNLENLDAALLTEMVARFASPKLVRAVEQILRIVKTEEYEIL